MGLQLPKRVRNIALGTVVVSALLFLSGCTADENSSLKRVAMPVPASKEAQYIFDLWVWAWVALGLTGLLVWGLIIYSVVRFRRRSDDEIPVQTRYHLPIEILYTIAPVIMVITFFYFTIWAQNGSLIQDDKVTADHKITVVGQQWSWTFNYENVDVLGGKTVHEVGTTAEIPTLWMVKDKSVHVDLYSPDVIHSFWVPAFLFKMDIVPGQVVPGRESPNHFIITPDREGVFDGRCSELCGVYHSRMVFKVKITSQEEYDAHMEELEAKGNEGKLLGPEFVNVKLGLENTTNESNGGDK